ncbi:sensor histidine kinase [Thiohalorhabdus sp.]|uniref:sensor histidine kinase n=1 Tax=Thiohalorhabdus sp. TaxID=3094134 RepID=UPI002FC34CA9
MRLRTKLLLLLTVATMPPLLAILFYTGYLGSRTLSEQVDKDMQLILERGVAEVQTLVEGEKAAARALAETPILERYLEALVRGEGHRTVHEQLEQYFLAYQTAKPSVQAIRLLDNQGNTLAKAKEGKVITPEAKGGTGLPIVANQSHKDFFQRAKRLDVGEVGMSSFELGRVDPQAEFCPAMIRYMVPLAYNGDKVGYLVVNGWGKRFDQILSGLVAERKGDVFLVESNPVDPRRDGIYLYHPSDEKRFANQRGNSAYLATNLGKTVYQAVQAQKSGVVQVPSSRDPFYFTRFSPYDEPTQEWILGVRAHTDALLATTNKMQASIAGVGALALLVILLLSRWAAAGVTTPIHRLATKVQRLAEGDLGVRCRSGRSDEVGSLARTFDYLADSLETAQKERDEAEAKACQAAKLASVGELAGGLAHEINNPLHNIRSLATLVERDLPDGVPGRVSRDLATLRQECEQCSRIIQGLLNFGRQMEPEFRQVALPELVGQCLELLERKAHSGGVTLRWAGPDASVPPVLGDPNQLQQVVVNTVLNALQASSEGQEVTVALERVDESMRLSVIDRGSGIPEEDAKRIFDPFFSTKPEGQGSGLGLSVSYGIVHRHGGNIRIHSELGQGTTVAIELPVAQLPADEPEVLEPAASEG